MSKSCSLSILRMSMEAYSIHLQTLYQMMRAQSLNLMNPTSFPLSLVISPEGPKSAGFMINLMKFGRNAYSSARVAEGLDISVGSIRKQLMGQINCFQLSLAS